MSQSMFVYMENHLLMLWQFANIPGVHDWHTYNCPDTPSRPMNNVHAITYRHKQQLVVWRVFSLNPTFFIIYYRKCLLIYVSVQYKPRRNILTWLWMDITYPFLLILLIKHYIRNIVVFEWIPCYSKYIFHLSEWVENLLSSYRMRSLSVTISSYPGRKIRTAPEDQQIKSHIQVILKYQNQAAMLLKSRYVLRLTITAGGADIMQQLHDEV